MNNAISEQDMYLKKLEIKKFGLWSDIDIIFPSKKLMLVVGNNGSGKTTLFNSIRSGLGLKVHVSEKIGENESDQTPNVDLTFDPGLITTENEFLFFIDELESLIHSGKIESFFSTLSIETRDDILKNASKLILEAIPEGYISLIIFDTNRFVVLGDDGRAKNYGVSENAIIGLSLLVAIKNYFVPNSFLIIDTFLSKMSYRKRGNILKLFEKLHSSQIILFLTNNEFSRIEPDRDFEYGESSVKEMVKELNLDSVVYQIKFDKNNIKSELEQS